MEVNDTSEIFSGVTFAVIPSDDIDEGKTWDVRDAMIQRKAEFVPLEINNEIQDLERLTHIVSTHVDFPEYAKAIDLNINVVKPSWVFHSITKRKATNPRQYSPDPSQFLHDVVLTTGTLPLGDRDSIEAACLAMGGLYSGPLQRLVTHLITTDDSHEKAQIVRQKNLDTKIVLPHWIDDCIKLGKKIGEGPYTFPDPEILKREKLGVPRPSPSPFLEGATSATPDGPPELKMPSPSASRKNLNAFMSKKIMLSKDLSLGDRHFSTLRGLITHGGGLLTNNVKEADSGPVYSHHHLRKRADYDFRPSIPTPALTQTCREIRAEALSVYLGGAIIVRVELHPDIEFDTVFFQRLIEDMGDRILYIRRLEIRHRIDLCLSGVFIHMKDIGTTTSTTTTFTILAADGSQCVDRRVVSVETALPPVDQGFKVCTCPVSSRFPQHSRLAFTPDTPLTRAVASFLHLMDTESLAQHLVSEPPFTHSRHKQSEDQEGDGLINYPACDRCGNSMWYLQGPPSSTKRREDGFKDDEVMYKGFKWKWCPFQRVNRNVVNRPTFIPFSARVMRQRRGLLDDT